MTPEDFEKIALWMGWERYEDGDGYEGWRQPLDGGNWKWHPIRKTSLTDAEAVEALNRLANSGYAPQLVYDDEGNWQLSLSTFGVMGEKPDGGLVVHVGKHNWQPTIHEAIEQAILELAKREG